MKNITLVTVFLILLSACAKKDNVGGTGSDVQVASACGFRMEREVGAVFEAEKASLEGIWTQSRFRIEGTEKLVTRKAFEFSWSENRAGITKLIYPSPFEAFSDYSAKEPVANYQEIFISRPLSESNFESFRVLEIDSAIDGTLRCDSYLYFKKENSWMVLMSLATESQAELSSSLQRIVAPQKSEGSEHTLYKVKSR